MKLLFSLIGSFVLVSAQVQAYPQWRETVPQKVYRYSQNKLRLKMMVNSCSGLFEGQKVRAQTVGCTTQADGESVILLKVEYKNHVSCDQGMDYITKISIDTRTCEQAPTMAQFVGSSGQAVNVKIQDDQIYRNQRKKQVFPSVYGDLKVCENGFGEKIVINRETLVLKQYLNGNYIQKIRLGSMSYDSSAKVSTYLQMVKDPVTKFQVVGHRFIVDPNLPDGFDSSVDQQKSNESYFKRCVTQKRI